MPSYLTDPRFPVPATTPGLPGYSYGSLDYTAPNTKMQVTNTALTSNVATYTVNMVSGPLPAVGQLVAVVATTNGSGAFNITTLPVASVGSFTTTNGVTSGTFTVAVTHANVTSAADSGLAVGLPLEGTDSAVVGKGLQFALPHGPVTVASDRVVSWSYAFPSAPASATINLQGANVDQDAAYTTLDSQASIVATGETRVLTVPGSVNFARITLSAVSGGTSPTVVGRISV